MVSEKEIEARAVTAFVRALSEPGAAVGDQKPAIANVNINYVVRAVLEAAALARAEANNECGEAVIPAQQPSGPVGVLEIAEKTRNLTFNVLTMDEHIHFVQEVLALTSSKPEQHPDDEAVDRFAAAMKAKLKWEREERGRYGWNDPEVCSEEYLAKLLIEHLAKGNEGNFEDIANFCMMLHQRGAHPRVLAAAFATAGKPGAALNKESQNDE